MSSLDDLVRRVEVIAVAALTSSNLGSILHAG